MVIARSRYLNPVDIYGKEASPGAIDASIMAAGNADVVVIAFGEHVYTEKPGDTDFLELPKELTAFVADVVAVGTPVVAVLIEGRTRLLEGCLDSAAAVIWAGLPGPEGGVAIAEVLVGITSPSGRMPISYPMSSLAGHYPYWHYVDSVCNYDSGAGAVSHLLVSQAILSQS
jgi:beta-glucosidase